MVRTLREGALIPRVGKGGKPDMARAALLIHAGVEVEDIHDSLPDVPKPETFTDIQWNNYEKSKAKLTGYFCPQTCNDFSIFELINTKMGGDETVASYTLRLREVAKKCDFTNWNAEKMIKALVISNMPDHDLRLKLLQKDRTLGEVLAIAQKKEDALARDKVIKKEGESSNSGVHKLGGMWPNKRDDNKKQTGPKCDYCGYEKHGKNKCPAQGKRCMQCGKTGHFEKMCWSGNSGRKKIVRRVAGNGDQSSSEEDTESDGERQVKKVSVLSVVDKITLMKVQLDGTETIWQPDTGT